MNDLQRGKDSNLVIDHDANTYFDAFAEAAAGPITRLLKTGVDMLLAPVPQLVLTSIAVKTAEGVIRRNPRAAIRTLQDYETSFACPGTEEYKQVLSFLGHDPMPGKIRVALDAHIKALSTPEVLALGSAEDLAFRP